MSLRDLVTIRTPPTSQLRAELLERLFSGLEPHWSSATELLKANFEADHCVIALQHAPGVYELLAASGLSPEWASRYEERFADLNPYMAEAKRRRPQGDEPVVAIADRLVPIQRVREMTFFREFCAPLAVNDAVCALLFDGGKPLGHVALRRSSGRLRYGESDEARLRSLCDVLSAALVRSRLLRELRARNAALDRMASGDGSGLVVLDHRGLVLDAAGSGRSAFDAIRDSLQDAVSKFLEDPNRTRGHFTYAHGDVPPSAPAGGLAFEIRRVAIEGRSRILCLLSSRPTEAEPTLTLPEDVHFTPREREVLTLLSRGLDNLSIARSLGIGLYTTKDHVKAIFRKLSVHTRAEAVAVLARGSGPWVSGDSDRTNGSGVAAPARDSSAN